MKPSLNWIKQSWQWLNSHSKMELILYFMLLLAVLAGGLQLFSPSVELRDVLYLLGFTLLLIVLLTLERTSWFPYVPHVFLFLLGATFSFYYWDNVRLGTASYISLFYVLLLLLCWLSGVLIGPHAIITTTVLGSLIVFVTNYTLLQPGDELIENIIGSPVFLLLGVLFYISYQQRLAEAKRVELQTRLGTVLIDKRRSERIQAQVEQHLQALDQQTVQWYRGQVVQRQQENVLFEMEIEGGSIGVIMEEENDFIEIAKSLQLEDQILLIGHLSTLGQNEKSQPQICLKAGMIVQLN